MVLQLSDSVEKHNRDIVLNSCKVLELRQYARRSGKCTLLPEGVGFGTEGTVTFISEGEVPGVRSDGDEGRRSVSQ